MKCPQCDYDNNEGASSCQECGFPLATESERNLEDLLAQIDEEMEIDTEEEEEDIDDVEIELPDAETLLPLRLGSLAGIREIIQGVIEQIEEVKDIPQENLRYAFEEEEITDTSVDEGYKKKLKELKKRNTDLRETIEDFQEEINDTFDELDRMVVSPQTFAVMKKAIKATRVAFQHYDEAFAELKLYFEDKNPDHLTTGLLLEEEANQYLSHAFNIVRETMTNMLGF